LRNAFKTEFIEELGESVKRLKFIDEFGANMGLTRFLGRAKPGQRVVESTPGYSGAHYTIVAAMGWQEVQASWVLDGAMNMIGFETYVESILSPTLRKGDIVVLDNLSAHKNDNIQRCIEARGARLVFLPPYSPDLNPIELCWSKVKTALRSAKARTLDALLNALADALRWVCRQDIRAWFAHCGYTLS
jgi:transposase